MTLNVRKLRKLSAYNNLAISELKKEQLKNVKKRKSLIIKKLDIKKKKLHNKEKGLSYDIFKEDYEDKDEKKEVVFNELSLTNELKYHIKMSNDDDNKERFKHLLNQIQQLKEYDVKEYINSIKEDFNNYKGEIKDLLHVKEMEERINNFLYSLSLQRKKNIISRNKMENKFSIKDGIFQSSIIDVEDTKNNNNIHYIKTK